MANRIQYQETITAANPSVSYTGNAGPMVLEGNFDTGTITQTLTGTTQPIETFTANDDFYFNGQGVTFTMASANGSESVVITWFKNVGVTYG